MFRFSLTVSGEDVKDGKKITLGREYAYPSEFLIGEETNICYNPLTLRMNLKDIICD